MLRIAVYSPDVRRPTAFAVVAVGVAIWAVGASYWRIGAAPRLGDESTYVAAGWRYLHWSSTPAHIRAHYANFEHPPLAKILFGVAQVLTGHVSVTASRAVAATCTMAAAIALAVWLARTGGRWTGLLAGALVVLVPTPIAPQHTNFGRAAMLDPVASAFMIASVVLAWFWFTARDRRAWILAAATGLAIGLATASKENGFLGAVGPVLLGLLLPDRSGTRRRVRAAQLGAASVVAGGVFMLSYTGLGNRWEHIGHLLRFQLDARAQGHTVMVRGVLTEHPPWWANLWFAWHSLGAGVAIALLVAVLAAVVLRRDRLVWWCLAALVAPIVFHCFVAGNALPFYWVMWMPALYALAALGIAELARLVNRAPGRLGRVDGGDRRARAAAAPGPRAPAGLPRGLEAYRWGIDRPRGSGRAPHGGGHIAAQV